MMKCTVRFIMTSLFIKLVNRWRFFDSWILLESKVHGSMSEQ